MESIAISEFKAKCPEIIERVRLTQQPITITRHGKPVAEVVPPRPTPQKRWLGCMRGTGKIVGDIVGPTGGEEDWTLDEEDGLW